ERRGRVSRRQAGIGGRPFERAEQEWIEMAADHRPRAADHALDDGDEQAWHADRKEREGGAQQGRGERRLRGAGRRRREEGRGSKGEGERRGEAGRLAEV